MSDANELDVLQAAWCEETLAVPPGLTRLVNHQTLLIRIHTAISVLVSIAFLGGSLALAIVQPATEFVVLAIAIWMITLTALLYSLTLRRGTWSPASHDTREFLQLSLRRCRAGLRAVTFGFYLLLAEVVLLAAWHAWYWHDHSPVPSLRDWLIASLLPIAFLIALVAARFYRLRELRRLEALQRELFR